MSEIEIKITPEGKLFARRLDGASLTAEDKEHARRLANNMPGITVSDVLRIFPGARVLTQEEARALMGVEGSPQ
jgi:hypothetical protein